MNDPSSEPEHRPASIADELACEIKRRRLTVGLSQRQLAAKIRYTRQYVGMAESQDAVLPSRELVAALDTELGADGALVALRAKAHDVQRATRKRNRATAQENTLADSTVMLPVIVDDPAATSPLDPLIGGPAARPASSIGKIGSGYEFDLPWTSDGALRCAELVSVRSPDSQKAIPSSVLIASAVDWLTVPTATANARRQGPPLDPELVDTLTERLVQLRHLDDAKAGPVLLEIVTRELQLAASLAAGTSYDQPTAVALFRVLAQLAQLAGWIAVDLSLAAHGQRLLLAALRFAHAGDDRLFGANVLSCLGYQTLWAGDGTSALRLVRLAQQGVEQSSHPRVAALLASREGRAHAIQGDLAACARALETAAHDFSTVDPATDPGPSWAYWVSEGVLTADAGRAWLEAGDPSRAAPLLARGVELLGDAQPRNRLLHGVSLANAYLQLGHADAAVEAGTSVLETARDHGSSRVRSRLDELRERLADSTSQEANALADGVADTLTT